MASGSPNSTLRLFDLPQQLIEKIIKPDLDQLLIERTINKDRKSVIDQELKHYYELVTGQKSKDMRKIITLLKQVNLLHTAIYGWRDIPIYAKIKELKSYDRNSQEIKDLLYRVMEYSVELIEEEEEGFLNEEQESPDDLLYRFGNISKKEPVDILVALLEELLDFVTDFEVDLNGREGLLLPILWNMRGLSNPFSRLFQENLIAFSIVGNVLIHLPNIFDNTYVDIFDYNMLKNESLVAIYDLYLYFGHLQDDPVYQSVVSFISAEKSKPWDQVLVGKKWDRHFEQVMGQSIHEIFYRFYIDKQKNY
jgi:hypothetical protein